MTPTFDELIFQNWAEHFHCPVSVLQQGGTTLLPDEKYAHQKTITLWHIGRHTFAIFDPSASALLDGLLAALPVNTSLSGSHIQNRLPDQPIESLDVDRIHYLPPTALPELAPPDSFYLRQVGPGDQAHMASLHDNCTPEEVDNGYVEVDHEIAFGCFHGHQLAAAASGYRMAGFMDIGVLTHSGFRQLGLGKVVVGALCAWAVQQNILAQYRCNTHNTASLGVARSLNFQPYFTCENIIFV